MEERDYGTPYKKYGKYSQKKGGFFARLLAFLATLVTGFLVYQVYRMDMFPLWYIGAGAGALALVLLLIWVLVFRRSVAVRVLGGLLALLLTVAGGIGHYYLYRTDQALDVVSVSGDEVEETVVEVETETDDSGEVVVVSETVNKTVKHTDEISVVVLADSKIQGLSDLKEESIGIQAAVDRTNTDLALDTIAERIAGTPASEDYNGMGDMVQALYEKNVSAIILNEAYRDLITDEYEDFDEKTRVLESLSFDSETEVKAKTAANVDVTKDPFIIYMSGIDTYGSISTRSRSDVNIMAVVNPTTRQILLVTTPRDLYVEVPAVGNAYDKLTHAGIYGIDASIDTLEQLYDMDINYYLRINFTGFMNIVDALGGVDVYSSKSFVGEVYDVPFSVGYNHVDGEGALSFVRERHSFIDGDFQRQRNQMEMIKAIVKKVASPVILTSYTSLLSSVESSFMTDMSRTEISSLVKMMLSDNTEWNIQTFGVSGTAARKTTYSMGNTSLYVEIQDASSIAEAKNKMQKVIDGGILTDADSVRGDQE